MSELQLAVDRPGLTRRMRDLDGVANCLRCKGGGTLWRMFGNVFIVGWQVNLGYACPACDGRGYWRRHWGDE